jgi:hypothetical protein
MFISPSYSSQYQAGILQSFAWAFLSQNDGEAGEQEERRIQGLDKQKQANDAEPAGTLRHCGRHRPKKSRRNFNAEYDFQGPVHWGRSS